MSPFLLPVWIALAFVLGSIPFGVLIARLGKGIDPRREGSGNPGATNVARLCGLPFGILTLVCDLLKGALPVWASLYLETSALFHSAVALAAVAGHIKSPFLGFHGGKGVATTIGVLLPLGFWPLVEAVLCCLAVIAVTSYVSLGSLTLITTLVVFYPLSGRWELLPLALILMVIIFWTHRANIRRLALGEEKSWRKPSGA